MGCPVCDSSEVERTPREQWIDCRCLACTSTWIEDEGGGQKIISRRGEPEAAGEEPEKPAPATAAG